MDHQVVIVGGGPAAHNAALILARARKRVLICDEGIPANRVAAHSHSFFTRDGTPPLELRRIAREQLAQYETVQFVEDRVTRIEKGSRGFRVGLRERMETTTRYILLALGMEVEDPGIPGFHELWGDTVIHCPYCHGWELRDRPWAVVLTDPGVPVDPRKLRSWTDDLVVVLDDAVPLPPVTRDAWKAMGFRIERGSVERLHARDGKLVRVELVGGREFARDVLLYAPPRKQAGIVEELGLEVGEDGCVVVEASGQTSIEGIYAAGDMTTTRHQIVFAAASGAVSAIAIDGALTPTGSVGG